jgi:uncharacterized protein (DUF305 family)
VTYHRTRHQVLVGAIGSAATAAALVAVAACGSTGTSGSGGDGMPGMSGMSGMSHSAMSGSTHNGADVTFAQSMIPHHQQAVDMANLATGRAGSPKVAQLAQRIAGAQQPEIATMAGWLTGWGAPTPQPHMSSMPGMSNSMPGMAGMSGTMPGMMTDEETRQLTAASGAAFDRLFLQLMTRHHQGAIQMAGTEQTGGQNPEAIALAKKITAAQTAEITEIQQLTAQM